MRFFVLVFLLLLATSQADEIDIKIKQTSSRLNTFSANYTDINKKMAQTAKEILEQKNEILRQQKHLQNLQEELGEKESSYEANITQLKGLKTNQQKLKESQNKIEEELVFTIAKSVSISIILEEAYSSHAESLIEFEVLKSMLEAAKKKAEILNEKFYENAQYIETLSKQASTLETSISNIDAKRKDLLQTQEKNKKSLRTLELAKNSYKQELENLLKKQDTLKKTLAELNIIKVDKIKKAQEDARRKKALESREISMDQDLPDVKRVGSSYQAVKTANYNGSKTIAPIDSYTITKKYGTYTDPIYGIKIFNESISLKSKEPNAKVKTVFNGKVIYADKTAVLNNIVIVEHDNGLHTIYANLSQIAPNIQKGVKIKKGYTIGRIDEELVFEVTQKSFHINPVRLFQ
jgi:murein DD-endopeptidase MepM/ murein hydrolase activator NlpD